MGHVFSHSFRIYRNNLKIAAPFFAEYILDIGAVLLFVFIVALALGASLLAYRDMEPQMVLYHLLTGGMPDFKFLGVLIFSALLMFLFFILIKGAARAATIGMAYQGIDGWGTDYGRGFVTARRHALAILGFLFVQAVLIATAAFLPFIPVVIGMALSGNSSGVLGAFLVLFGILGAVVLAVGVFFFTLFAPQQIVVKRTGVLPGIRKSAEFVYSHPTDVIKYSVGALAISTVALLIVPNIFLPIIHFSKNVFLNTALEILQSLLSIIATIFVNAYLETVKTAMVVEG
jgi:hypothetical protein